LIVSDVSEVISPMDVGIDPARVVVSFRSVTSPELQPMPLVEGLQGLVVHVVVPVQEQGVGAVFPVQAVQEYVEPVKDVFKEGWFIRSQSTWYCPV